MPTKADNSTRRKSRHNPLRRGLPEMELSYAEIRVARQLRIVQRLRDLQVPTEKAERRLKAFNFALKQLQNHHEIMSNLLLPAEGRVTRMEGY